MTRFLEIPLQAVSGILPRTSQCDKWIFASASPPIRIRSRRVALRRAGSTRR